MAYSKNALCSMAGYVIKGSNGARLLSSFKRPTKCYNVAVGAHRLTVDQGTVSDFSFAKFFGSTVRHILTHYLQTLLDKLSLPLLNYVLKGCLVQI